MYNKFHSNFETVKECESIISTEDDAEFIEMAEEELEEALDNIEEAEEKAIEKLIPVSELDEK